MKFITCHLAGNTQSPHAAIVINLAWVRSFTRLLPTEYHGGGTCLTMHDGQEYYVSESLEHIENRARL